MEPPNQSGRKNTMERSLRNGDFLFNFSLLFLLLLLCFVFPRTPKNPDKRYGLFVLRVFHLRRYTQHSIGLAYCVCRKRFRDWRLRTEKWKIRAAFPQRARMSPANRRCMSVFVCVCVSPFVSATTTTATNPYQCALALYVRVWLL